MSIAPPSCPRCGSAVSTQFGLCPLCAGRMVFASHHDAEDAGDEADEAPAATVLGGYELGPELGRGAMGVVYRVRDRRLGRTAALKVVLSGRFASAAERQRFMMEAEAAARLEHHGIVTVYDSGEADSRLFYVMQLVDGPSLAARLQQGPMPPRQAAEMLARIARAVQHAHERGVLHRDLKPANVLLDADGLPHVADFGLARQLDRDSSLTLAGSPLGTPAYMAPEASSPSHSTAAADVWSLGVMFYEMLSGAPPFTGPTLTDVLLSVREREPASIHTIAPGVDRDLASICARCLEKEPQKRYRTAGALADDVERWLRGEPVRARPATARERLVKWARRRPALAAVAAVAVLLFVGGTAGVTWQWRRATHHAEMALAHAKRESEARRSAEANELDARRALYAADMNQCLATLKANNLGQARGLLDAHRPVPGRPDLRGWEWRYLWTQCRSAALSRVARTEREVTGIGLSHDGTRTVTNEFDGHLRVWDTATGNLVSDVRTDGYHGALALSPREDLLLAPLNRKECELRTLDGTRSIKLAVDRRITDAAFSPDGELAAAQDADGTTRIWQTSDGGLRTTIKESQITYWHGGAVAFVPGPERLIAAGSNSGKVRLYHIGDGSRVRSWEAHPGRCVSAIAVSPDGRFLATGACYDDAEVRVWDTATGARVAVLPGHSSWVSTLLFTPDGAQLISTGADQTIRFWNTNDWSGRAVLRGHQLEVWSAALSPDGKRLITGGKDGEVLLWPGRPDATSSGRFDFPPEVTRVSDAAGSGELMAGSGSGYSRWTPGEWHEVPCKDVRPGGVAYNTEGYGVRKSAGGMVEFISFATATPTVLQRVQAAPYDSVSISRGGAWAVLVRSDGRLTLVNLQDGSTRELPPRPAGISASHFDSEGRRVLAFGGDGSFYRYDIPAGRWLEPLRLPASTSRCTVLGDGSMVLVTEGRRVMLRRLEPPLETVFDLEQENDSACVAVSVDGQWMAVANDAGVARLWRLHPNGNVGEPRVLRGHLNAVHAVTFTADSTRLVTLCSNMEAAKFWDVGTGREVLTLSGAATLLYHAGVFARGEVLAASRNPTGGPWHAWHAPSLEAIARAEASGRW